MTENTITVAEVLKSKQNFSSFIELNTQKVIEDLLEGYPNRTIRTIYPQLTPNSEGLVELLKQFESIKKGYLFWFIANEKEDLLKIPRQLNELFVGGSGIFVVKANLNEDKIEFECLLKPELVTKQSRVINTDTVAKQLQKSYWETYIPTCLESDYTEMQIKDALPRHYQNISIGVGGVQILQTINTQNNYVASEIAISNKKEIFEKLLEHKEEIESEIGELEWDSKENVKSAKIRKTFKIDINNPENHEKAILEHVKMGTELMLIAKKYLK